MKDYKGLEWEALQLLDANLSEKLHYHGLSHTLEVLYVCNQYIDRENLPQEPAGLLRVGALMHDIGFTVSLKEHEALSMKLAGPMMKKHGYTTEDYEVVKGLIRSTKVPQSPHNHLEEIICDSDLDYLGRDDFYRISQLLFEELQLFSIVKNKTEWNRKQVVFLEAHRYHTDFACRYRQPKKEERIRELKALLGLSL